MKLSCRGNAYRYLEIKTATGGKLMQWTVGLLSRRSCSRLISRSAILRQALITGTRVRNSVPRFARLQQWSLLEERCPSLKQEKILTRISVGERLIYHAQVQVLRPMSGLSMISRKAGTATAISQRNYHQNLVGVPGIPRRPLLQNAIKDA